MPARQARQRRPPARGTALTAAPRRILLAAFGDPGHAFPAIALGRELAARGHDVTLETWSRWREHVEREGMRFAAAPEYQVFPTRERPLKPYAAAVRASAVTAQVIREVDPEVVVADILTVAAALAAELEGRPWATLVPHVLPMGEPGFPVYALGGVRARSGLGERMWSLSRPLLMKGEEQGRRELNGARERVGLPPLEHVHGGISRWLALVATFPQLEYPRRSDEAWLRVTGPLMWEQPFGEVELPPGRRAARAGGAQHLAGPGRAAAAAPRWRDSRTSRCACSRRRTGARPRACRPCRRTRGWSTGSPTRGPCRAATR